MFRFRSVVARTISLHLVAIVVTSLFMPLALYLMLRHAAESLHDRALRQQAAEILGYIEPDATGGLQLKLPAPLAELYSEAYGRYAFAVLELLMRSKGRVVSKKQVEDHIFGHAEDVASNAVEVYVHRLRKQLAERGAKVQVHTIRGVGYLIAEEK